MAEGFSEESNILNLKDISIADGETEIRLFVGGGRTSSMVYPE